MTMSKKRKRNIESADHGHAQLCSRCKAIGIRSLLVPETEATPGGVHILSL